MAEEAIQGFFDALLTRYVQYSIHMLHSKIIIQHNGFLCGRSLLAALGWSGFSQFSFQMMRACPSSKVPTILPFCWVKIPMMLMSWQRSGKLQTTLWPTLIAISWLLRLRS
jgi:hypothetical protein